MLNITSGEDERLLAKKFPLVCPHCDATYWHAPGEIVSAPGACTSAIFEQRKAGGLDEGSKFWRAMLADGISKGRKLAEKEARREMKETAGA